MIRCWHSWLDLNKCNRCQQESCVLRHACRHRRCAKDPEQIEPRRGERLAQVRAQRLQPCRHPHHHQLQPRRDTHEHSNGKGNVECVALLVEAGCDTAAVAVATKATKRRPVLTRGDSGDASHLLDEAQRRDESRDERQGQRAVLETTRVVVRRRLCARRRSATANSDGSLLSVSWC